MDRHHCLGAPGRVGASLKYLVSGCQGEFLGAVVESFIDRSRFSGASYRAANWVAIDWTRGFAKRRGRFVNHGQRQEVHVYVIEPRKRQRVHQDVHQPLSCRSLL